MYKSILLFILFYIWLGYYFENGESVKPECNNRVYAAHLFEVILCDN